MIPEFRKIRVLGRMPYRMGHAERDFAKQETQKMLADGFIKPSASEWASIVVLSPKCGGVFRFCLDYR